MSKLILIMIDGISAEYFANHRARMPHLAALAEQGLVVNQLHSDVPGTSLTGRTTMITGVTADVHGVWGNVIWDGERFRYANPDDVRVPTLSRQALDAGLDVAVTGYGMVRPEDATVFHHAWWANEMLQRARDLEPIPADEGWLRTSRFKDPTGRLVALAKTGLPAEVPDAYAGDRSHYFASEIAGDQIMMQWTAGLALSDNPPDLILTEILTPDSVQHQAGYKHAFSHWSISYADSLVGTLLEQLRQAGRLDDYAFAIMSDHGHAAVHTAIYPEVLLPEVTLQPEGSLLHVIADSKERKQIAGKLAPYGIEAWHSEHVPVERREAIATFVAPEGHYFGHKPASGEVIGPAQYLSMHGFKPGSPDDDRFAVFMGKGIPQGFIETADAVQVAPTLAKVVGLPLEPYPAKPLF
jgi:predicted AlkP superfamily pyrophosphatase or phosphodiesterase